MLELEGTLENLQYEDPSYSFPYLLGVEEAH